MTIIIPHYFEVPLNDWFANCEMELLRGSEKNKDSILPD